jgi:archaellum component FlaG (FlaF/FlaG flagellin family)
LNKQSTPIFLPCPESLNFEVKMSDDIEKDQVVQHSYVFTDIHNLRSPEIFPMTSYLFPHRVFSDENESSTLSRLATVAAQLQATVSGSLTTMAQNLKQSVETMAAFNTMMETYLIKSLSIKSERGKIVKEGDKINFTFQVCLSNIGSYSIPAAAIQVSLKSTLDTEMSNVIGQIDVPMISAGSTLTHRFAVEASHISSGSYIISEVSFPSPGTGGTLRGSSSRPIGILELAQLAVAPITSFETKASEYIYRSTSRMVDAAKLRDIFGVHPIQGLSGLVFNVQITGKYNLDIVGLLETTPVGESTSQMVGFSIHSKSELPGHLLESIISELN